VSEKFADGGLSVTKKPRLMSLPAKQRYPYKTCPLQLNVNIQSYMLVTVYV